MLKPIYGGLGALSLIGAAALVAAVGAHAVVAQEAPAPPARAAGLIRTIEKSSERMEMTVNTSRILTLGKKIPQAQVNNPDLLELTALEPNQIQVHAKKAGVTQINLWDEDKQLYTVDVVIYGDAEELTMLLRTQFPKASLKVIPVASGALISGYVDQPEHVSRIIQIAEEFYPKVIANITVGGVQQVLLHVKVMEVSRTKMRALGFDWAQLVNGNLIMSSASGLIAGVSAASGAAQPAAVIAGSPTFQFRVVDGASAFFGVLEALREDNLMKVLAEPTLVTVSGRPAFFNSGGEFPILVPESLGTVSIEYKKFGTQVDFVPIVLGNGRIRLEVKPRVSEIDNSRSVTVQSINVPGLNVREVDTGVEMSAGQTLAIAGLVQNRIESHRRGIPGLMEVPYLGALFRKVEETNNEIELLILVTPELVEALDAHEVPRCGPGMATDSPSDWQLYFRGHNEVPRCCPDGGPGCAQCNGAGPGGQDAPGAEVAPLPAAGPQPPQAPLPPQPVPPAAALRRPAASQVAAATPAPGRYIRSNRQNPPAAAPQGRPQPLQGFMGPIGYDVAK